MKDRTEALPWQDPLQANIPEIRDGYLAAVYYGQRRSGDFYDFVRASSGRVLFGLFDVAGDFKRTRPIVFRIQQEFRSLGARLLEADDANESESLFALWVEINRTVLEVAGRVHCCPAFLGCYNDQLGTIACVNAGHTPALVRHAHEVSELKATALPLGLFSHSIPDASLVALMPGDAFLLVSRGIVEASYRQEEYGMERVKEYLHETRFRTARETCLGILSRVQQFMRTAPTHNDVTALSLVRAS